MRTDDRFGLKTACYPSDLHLKVIFVATCMCERPLCGDTNTLAKAPRHTPKTLSKITESQSRRVCCTIRNIFFLEIFFFLNIFHQFVLLVRAGCNQLHQRSKLLHPAWQWAGRKIQCLKVFLVLSLCYNRHFIQSWLKLKRASSGGWKHNCCADCFISNGVWCMDAQGPEKGPVLFHPHSISSRES